MKDNNFMISFKEVYVVINSLFNTEISAINADWIIRKSISLGYEFKFEKVPYWEAFENGHIYYSDQYLLSLIFKTKNRTDKVMVITDESYQCKKVPVIDFIDLEQFVTKEYSVLFKKEGIGVDFFQCSDIIFLSYETGFINILHHEGIYLEIDVSKLTS